MHSILLKSFYSIWKMNYLFFFKRQTRTRLLFKFLATKKNKDYNQNFSVDFNFAGFPELHKLDGKDKEVL